MEFLGATPPRRPQVSARAAAARRFVTTRWSIVHRARGPDAAAALTELCRSYWYPVYSYVRAHAIGPEDAADITQGLFEQLLTRNDIATVDPAKGQFRSWLRACARNYLRNWFAHRRTLCSGGGAPHVPIDTAAAEERLRLEASDGQDPERLFDRRWALELIERALTALRAHYERAGKAELFRHLHAGLGGRGDTPDSDLARLLGKSSGAIKVERHRMRQRFHGCLRREVAHTVPTRADVDDELRRLLDALA